MSFNEYLKGELEYQGMLVKELAQKTGIPKQTLDKYLLTNGSMPPVDKAVTIAHTLGVSVEYLVTGRKLTAGKTWNQFLSPELRSIADRVEPLPREQRKIVEDAVAELVGLLQRLSEEEPRALTPLQKIFLQLFR
jgi:transcriptional regulator with XRE-family HTH domain